MPRKTPIQGAAAPALRVVLDSQEFRFCEPFYIGRSPDCEIRIDDSHIGRKHVHVFLDHGRWHFSDLQSVNGIFVDGARVQSGAIDDPVTVHVGGVNGPALKMEVEGAAAVTQPRRTATAAAGETVLLDEYAERYFGAKATNEPIGERTRLIRRAFENVQRKQQRKYTWVIAALAVVVVAAASYAFYARRQMLAQQALAEELFYSMKALDVQIANVERSFAASGNQTALDQVKTYLDRRRDMEATYDKFLSGLRVYGRDLSDEERLILRVTRLFGECELIAPPEYLNEVTTYIRRWQSTGRYARAVKLAQEKGYTRRIAEEFIAHNLPPQFFYLAMQESDFDPFRSGPPTRFGIAKGMWQFIPETGSRYGLSPGPLAQYARPDPQDDRSQWEKATGAAARYIKDIYATDAQASGLLVMASYNWGERRVVDLIRRMPANPRERNFWKLLEQYRSQVPKETYDYVFYIISAAVIGENPRLFGFPLESPLASLHQQ
jgi:pSer/pThr/pTyr-binding forkhead associated (FHA) protein